MRPPTPPQTDIRLVRPFPAIRAALAIALAASLWGCAATSHRATATATGRIIDVNSAVARGASKTELAILRIREPDNQTRTFDLVGYRDEPATVVITTDDWEGPFAESREFEITATVGLFAEPSRSRSLADQIAKRLDTLNRRAQR